MMLETKTYKPVRITNSPEAVENGLQLFTRKDGQHASIPDHLRVIYYRFQYSAETETGQVRTKWSGIKSTKTRNEQEALAFAIEQRNTFLKRLSRGRNTDVISLKTICELYLESETLQGRSKSTRAGLSDIFSFYSRRKELVQYHHLDVDEASHSDFLEMFRMRAERAEDFRRAAKGTHYLTNKTGKLHGTTIAKECASMRRALKWASKMNIHPGIDKTLTAFPTAKELQTSSISQHVDFGATSQAHNSIFTEDEIRLLIATINEVANAVSEGNTVEFSGKSVHSLGATRLAFSALLVLSFGVRAQEVMKLKEDDLNFTGDVYSIRMVDVAKTRKQSNVLDRYCFARNNQPALRKLLDALLYHKNRIYSARKSPYLFHNDRRAEGKPVKVLSLKPLLEQAGVPTVRHHGDRTGVLSYTALRRTTISRMISAGVSVHQTADLHGTSPAMVEASYRRTTSEGAKRAALEVPELF